MSEPVENTPLEPHQSLDAFRMSSRFAFLHEAAADGVGVRNRISGLMGRFLTAGETSIDISNEAYDIFKIEKEVVGTGDEEFAGVQKHLVSYRYDKDKPRFIPKIPGENEATTMFYVRGDEKIPLYLPVANIVTAHGMQSWKYGEGKSAKHKGPAHIRSLARTPSHKIPPIDGSLTAICYVEPSGAYLISMSSGRHRAAAAHARGDEFLPIVGGVLFKSLPQKDPV